MHIVKGDVAPFSQTLEVMTHHVGVNVAVTREFRGRRTRVLSEVEINFATSVIPERVSDARDRRGEERRIEVSLAIGPHTPKV